MKLFALLFFVSHVWALFPIPRDLYTNGTSVVWLPESLEVTYNGQQLFTFPKAAPPMGAFTSLNIVQAAVQRACYRIFAQSFVPWKAVPRDQLSSYEPSPAANKTYISCLTITQTEKDNATFYKSLPGQVDESYELNIEADGSANLTAPTSTGVLRGLETFTQLFYRHSIPGVGIYSNLAPVAIKDSPKFAYRGLNLDLSRNWIPVPDILRTIDALSWNKFNHIHLHISDAQSWPMYIPAIPELAEKGAYGPGLFYTPADIQEIQTYAIYRGIEPIIEFDMPGHTSSIAFSHPELIAAFEAENWSQYCAEPPCGTLKLNSSAVTTFIDTLLGDVLPRVVPYSSYFHCGGDEVNANAYLLDNTVMSNETSVLAPLIQRFIDNVYTQVRNAGLTPMAWEEMITTWDLDLGQDVLVQAWISQESIATITSKGYKVIGGSSDFWYLDCGRGQWLDFQNGDSFKTYYPFADYCSPTKNWRLAYSYDLLANLTAEQAALVIGGEAHAWAETMDPMNLDDLIWPRTAAIGENLWSGNTDSTGQNRSQLDVSPRLADQRERMVARGIKCGPVQMIFCTQLNATMCSL